MSYVWFELIWFCFFIARQGSGYNFEGKISRKRLESRRNWLNEAWFSPNVLGNSLSALDDSPKKTWTLLNTLVWELNIKDKLASNDGDRQLVDQEKWGK